MSRLRRLGIVAVAVVVALLAAVPAFAVEAPPGAHPVPGRRPAFDASQSSGVVVGRLIIPSIGVDEVIREGVAPTVLDRGVAHWVGTAGPGDPGNMVLAGHRTTHTAPFRDLDRLRIGDVALVERDGLPPAIYRVGAIFVVDPGDVWITYELGRPMLTMFACHPKGSARHRIVVQADLVGAGLIS